MPHLIVIFVVVLVVFGPKKLPELARGLGKLMAEFRRASTDFRSAFEEEMRDLERQALQAERKKVAEASAVSAAAEPSQPATLDMTANTETQPADASAEAHATEAPVISPVAESVPRSSEEMAEGKTDAAGAANLPQTSQDTQYPA